MKSTRAVRIIGAVTIVVLLGLVMILCPVSAAPGSAAPAPGPAVVAVQQDSRVVVDEKALGHRRRSTLCTMRWVVRWYKWSCVWLD